MAKTKTRVVNPKDGALAGYGSFKEAVRPPETRRLAMFRHMDADCSVLETWFPGWTWESYAMEQGAQRVYTGRASFGGYLQFKLSTFPGCCGLCVSFNTVVRPSGRYLGTRLMAAKKEIARLSGYTMMLATDVAVLGAETALLRHAGFKRLCGFKNRDTGNAVVVWGVRL